MGKEGGVPSHPPLITDAIPSPTMKVIISTVVIFALSMLDVAAQPVKKSGSSTGGKPAKSREQSEEGAASSKTAAKGESADANDKAKKEGRGEKIFGLLDTEHVQVDLRAIEAAKGEFGIEYKFHFAQSLRKNPVTGQTWDASLSGEGFLVTDPTKNQHDSIVTEAALSFNPLWIYGSTAPVRPAGNIWESGTGTERKLDQGLANDGRSRAGRLQSPLWIYAKGSAKWETTQDGRDQDIAVGASLAATTSFLNPILDAPFKVLRFGNNRERNNPRHLDVSAGYDYVTARKVSSTATKDDKNRIAIRAEWETGIFRDDRVAFVFTGHYDLDGATQGFHPFFEAKYLHLLLDKPGAKTSFAIKYTVGELAPTYKQGNLIGAGFSIEFN